MDEKQEYINKEVNETLSDHSAHLQIANREMGMVQQDIAWLKGWAGDIDKKLWAIIVLLIGTAIKIFIQ